MTFSEFFRAVWMEVQFQRTGGSDSRATFTRNMSWVRRCSFSVAVDRDLAAG